MRLVQASSRRLVRLAEYDSDLFGRLPAQEFELARRRVMLEAVEIPRGHWAGGDELSVRASIGLLVLDGVMLRSLEIDGHRSTELLGPGDLLKPWVDDGAAAGSTTSWRVRRAALLAILDRRFTTAATRWPSLMETLTDRLVLRSRRLATTLTASHYLRVADRLRLLLTALAERWGRVTPDGIVLPLPLTHRDLGELIGAQRPSVTTALGTLRKAGFVEPHPGGWVLKSGQPLEDSVTVRERFGQGSSGRAGA